MKIITAVLGVLSLLVLASGGCGSKPGPAGNGLPPGERRIAGPAAPAFTGDHPGGPPAGGGAGEAKDFKPGPLSGDKLREPVSPDHGLPRINNITPNPVGEGESITINGVNFGDRQISCMVRFNRKTSAEVSSWSGNQIVCKFPSMRGVASAVNVIVNGKISLSYYITDKSYRLPLEWVTVPAGSFLMGSLAGEGNPDEHPRHKVYLDAYQISKY